MELLTAARMRAIEGAEIGSGRVTGLELMERAAEGLAAAVPAEAAAVAVLCGPGNNGGDGYAAARLLAARGQAATVFEMTDAPATPDAAENRRRWIAGGGAARPLAAAEDALRAAALRSEETVCIDALFGAGLTRPLGGDAAALARLFRDHITAEQPFEPPFTIACDVPSGLCADSGRPLGGLALRADLTVTFHAPKPGHHLGEGPAMCGGLIVHDIGLPPSPPAPDAVEAFCAAPAEAASSLWKRADAHKYDYGHALILSGGVGRGGAARLAARGALRTGAGLVTLGCPPAAVLENASRLDAVMLARIADAEALSEVLEDRRINAVALGMGLGATGRAAERTRDLTRAALAARRGTVLDADALTVWREAPAELFDLLHHRCVLTPHMGEFARLFPDLADRLAGAPARGPAFSALDAVAAASERAGCTVLLKGAATAIASTFPTTPATAWGWGVPGRAVHPATYDRAVPWLATAGAGDVLAGIIAGLLARGWAPQHAASRGAWLHAEAARAFGPGLIAEDIPEVIPRVLRAAFGGPEGPRGA